MSVRHVFAQANVCDDQERWQLLFQQADRLLDDSIFRKGAGGFGVLLVRNAKQQDSRDADGMGAFGFVQEFVYRQLEDAGHGADFTSNFFSGPCEERKDELARVQLRFPDKFPQRGRGAQAARTVFRKLGCVNIHETILI